MIGGECFGGFFGRSRRDGNYYLQSGHIRYQIYRLHGLDGVQRSQGVLDVGPAQVAAAERAKIAQIAGASAPREAAVPARQEPLVIDGLDGDWAGTAEICWDRDGRFPVSVRAARDDDHLYLFYTVRDGSPWRNTGTDLTLLFKTGDSVDLQLGGDPGANPDRLGPVPGDFRLLIAPFEGRNAAVLYRHRLAGESDPVTFTSPWRSETVDSVSELARARVAVVTAADGYRLEAAIPLADLGLGPRPGRSYRADFGVLYGDDAGETTLLRSYWSNRATGLVNDVPGEIMLTPRLWGTVTFPEVRP
jgi:hypothetical protein